MSRFWLLRTLVSAFLMVSIPLTTAAQQASGLSRQAAGIKRIADTLSLGSKISVIPFHGAERFGAFVSNGSESFTFHDIDDKTDVTLKYSDVRKLKQGYGGYNSVSGKHTDRKHAVIAIVVVLGIIGGLLVAVTQAKN